MSSIEINTNGNKNTIRKIISKPQLYRALTRVGMLLEYKTKENIVRKGLVDHGYLLNSIKYTVDLNDTGGTVTIGSYGVKYAAIHEFGGDIYPRRARALTIPVAPWAKYHRARDFDLVRIGSILVDPKKAKGKIPIPKDAIGFRLAKKVTMPERSYMRAAIDQSLPRIIRILSSETGANT
jgi:phage gpG-like protein